MLIWQKRVNTCDWLQMRNPTTLLVIASSVGEDLLEHAQLSQRYIGGNEHEYRMGGSDGCGRESRGIGQEATFFIRVVMADLRALLYMRCFSLSLSLCFAFCAASTTKADLATLHRRLCAARAHHGCLGLSHRSTREAWCMRT